MTDRTSPPSPLLARRYLSLHLPYLSTDRHHRQTRGRSWREAARGEERASAGDNRSQPLAVVAKVRNALRLVALDKTAERAGLVRGMALADARAMIPQLAVVDDDPAADAVLLDEIAAWAERYTPLVACDGTDGLALDITGCAHLFGGETPLVADLARRLRRQGFRARAAIADTPGAASAAARFARIAVVPVGGSAEILAPLPLAALRLDGETVSAMDRVGLKCIDQIIGAPRAPLAARFGRELLRKLDQALGTDEEAISPRRPPPAFIAERRFAEPIGRHEDIAATLASLAATLAGHLEAHGAGARRIVFTLFRVDGVVTEIAVGTGRPVRAPETIVTLFREKFSSPNEDEIDAGFGFDMARLSVTVTAAADPAQIDLDGTLAAETDLGTLIDRIAVRLGPDSVGRIALAESHIPERAETIAAADEFGPRRRTAPLSGERPDRPLRLFARPEPVEAIAEVPDGPPVHFRWRRALYRIARAEGPERIAPEWWREEAFTRDYFRVEDSAGHRFWLFREGLYGREVRSPRWFVHGVFA